MNNKLVLKGVAYLCSVPILMLVGTLLFLFSPYIDFLIFLVVVFQSALLFVLFMFGKNSYTDSQVLEMVEIPNAPEKVKDLLKKQNIRHQLVNVRLISIVAKKKKLSESDLVKCVQKTGIELTHPAIASYSSELVDFGILACKKGPYKKEYLLTDKGRWCYKAIKKCFPKSFFFFVIRHYLGIRNLPEFPKDDDDV